MNQFYSDIVEQQILLEANVTYGELAEKYGGNSEQIRYVFRKHKVKFQSKFRKSSELTVENIEEFIQDFNKHSYSYFSSKFNVSDKSLRLIAKNNNLIKITRVIDFPQEKTWAETEVEYLKNNFQTSTLEEMEIFLGKSSSAVKKKLWELDLPYATNSTKWSIDEDNFLRKNIELGIPTISFLLERSSKAIRHRILLLKLETTKPQKTSIEVIVEDILKEIGISYIYNKPVSKKFLYRPDFQIPSKKIIVETHGDYWHANPAVFEYDALDAIQLLAVEKDSIKKEYYESLDYKVIILWESDIKNIAETKKLLKESLL